MKLNPGRVSLTAPAPQVSVTIELSGEYGQLAPMLAELSRLFGDRAVLVQSSGAGHSWWTEDRAAAFVAELKPPALHALRVICTGAPKVTVSHVQAEMARAGMPTTPGTLSSIGFAVRRHGCPAPFIRDGYKRAYVMDKAVAGPLLVAVEAEDARRRHALTTTRGRRVGPAGRPFGAR
jgi:hypothetical protein